MWVAVLSFDSTGLWVVKVLKVCSNAWSYMFQLVSMFALRVQLVEW